jgi:hypothetical protein
MKKEVSNPVPAETDERTMLIRSMVLNFRKHTLTCADHEMISAWLHEAAHHHQLFERWLLDAPAASAPASRNSMPVASHPGNPLVSGRGKLMILLVFLAVVLLFFRWLF